MKYLNNYFKKVPEGSRSAAAIAYMAALDQIEQEFPQIVSAIVKELSDQRSSLKLIASENYSSLTVQLAMGNLLTDKYSEGYPHHRFYAGCENVDTVEDAAIREAKDLFGCEHVYVQPHSGADANMVAYWAVLVHRVQNKEVAALGRKSIDELSAEEYEKIRSLVCNQKMMGLSLNSGGHLTHGFKHNNSAKMMRAVSYDVDPKTGLIDYKALQELVTKEKPAIFVAGYSAYPRLLNFAKMREIADSVGATFIVDMAHFSGLVAGKVMQGDFDPIPFAHIVTSTTHKTLRGPRGGLILCKGEYREVIDKGCPLVLGGPLPHVMAAKAIAFKEANSQKFRDYAHQIVKNAQALAERFSSQGVALTTGGTDNHLMVLDVAKSFGLTGKQAETALRNGGFTSNRNAIPFDVNGAWYTSGIRLGTPAVTTLGLKESEMQKIGDAMITLLRACRPGHNKSTVDVDPAIIAETREQVTSLLKQFPLYPELVID